MKEMPIEKQTSFTIHMYTMYEPSIKKISVRNNIKWYCLEVKKILNPLGI